MSISRFTYDVKLSWTSEIYVTLDSEEILWLQLRIGLLFLDLEAEANAPLEKTLRLSSEEAKYCIYMMEKYGEDYKVWYVFFGLWPKHFILS